MKIGILTYHNVYNYGAVLQAFCLQQTLRKLGHSVSFVNYMNPNIKNRIDSKNKYSWSNPIKYILKRLTSSQQAKRKQYFKDFVSNELSVTIHEYTENSIVTKEHFETVIIGSDQVWNPLLTGGIDKFYYGLNIEDKINIYTYAVSSGPVDYFDKYHCSSVFPSCLKKFKAISVREERLKQYIKEKSGRETEIVLDPTLMADSKILDNITPPRLINSPYILVYSVDGDNGVSEFSCRVAKLYDARIIWVKPNKMLNRKIHCYNASVYEFLSLIKYSECVIAKSFHGTALSIIYEKEFFSVKSKNMDRITSLLSPLNLTSRIVDVNDSIESKPSFIDYNSVNLTLGLMREVSLSFLKSNLV